MMVLPLVPGIISAIAFRIYTRLEIEPGMGAIVWAHAVHAYLCVAGCDGSTLYIAGEPNQAARIDHGS